MVVVILPAVSVCVIYAPRLDTKLPAALILPSSIDPLVVDIELNPEIVGAGLAPTEQKLWAIESRLGM